MTNKAMLIKSRQANKKQNQIGHKMIETITLYTQTF